MLIGVIGKDLELDGLEDLENLISYETLLSVLLSRSKQIKMDRKVQPCDVQVIKFVKYTHFMHILYSTK